MIERTMTHFFRAGLAAGIALSGLSAKAQLTVAPQTNLQQLAEAISGAGVRISNPVINCHGQGYGEFDYAGTALGLQSGVILTSGRITDALGPNNVENRTFQQGTPGSPLLNTVTGRTTFDACLFEFDVIPSGDSLSFQFVFGSEEYNEWVGSQYNDVFGFFISGPGIVGDPGIGADRNIALVPGTSNAVAINNVNAGSNSAYYHYNAGDAQLQMDGYTRGLVAKSAVQPCQTYHLKLVVADASDRKFDSWVFIERIQSPNVSLSTRTVNGTVNMVEGCNPGWIRFTRDPVTPQPLTLSYFLQGTATNGVDYSAIGNVNPNVAKTITIPAGLPFAEQPVNPLADAIAEPTEHLRILLGNPNCPGFVIDSIDFAIADTLIATVSPAGTQTICHGSSTQFDIQGGMVYAWTPATGLSCTNCPNPIASPTVTTTYTVVINEGTCVRTVSRQVRVSNTTVSGIVTQPLCNSSANGAINITATGGFAPYTYAWTGPNGFTANTEDLVNIGAGSYTVTVTDASGCQRVQGFNVGSPASLSLTLSPSILPFGQNIACHGASTGTLGLSISGGTGPYATAWTGPNGFTSFSQNLSGIGAGTYSVTVTDANGCSATSGFTMVQSNPLVAGISASQNALCAGSATGTATASATGGMPPYSYAWNSSPAQSGETATGLAQGSYTVTITDGYGCTATAQASIGQPAPVTVSLSGTSHILNCQGQSQQHGSATANASGGTGPYSYSWNTSPTQSTATASFISGGTYTVTATDANGCTGTRNFTVNQPGNITAQITAQTNVGCFGGNTGSATVSITGGSNIQSLTWNTSPTQSGPFATNLPAGTWTLTAQHADGCVTQVPVTITQPAAALSSSISAQTNVSCFGNSTGSATVSASGGAGPYAFTWNTSPVQSGATASSLPAGTFTCTITDANGCTVARNVTIAQPAAALSSSISAQTNVSCFGNSTGSATVSASGGTGPYAFTWNTSPVQSGATASNLPAGTFTCTITDANGCTATRNVNIAQPAAALSSSISAQTNVSCFGNSTGSATVSASGGTAPYSFAWNTSPVQSGATASNLPAGTFTCTITDANGCTVARNVTIAQPAAALALSGTTSAATCGGASNGAIDASISGGTAPYTIAWSGPGGYASISEDISGLASGVYTLSVSDANGCTAAQAFSVNQPGMFTIDAVLSSHSGYGVSCANGADGSISITASGGTGPYTHAWTGPNGFTASTQSISGAGPGTYTYTITDSNGCSAAESFTLTAPAPLSIALASATVNGGWSIACHGAPTGSIDANASGGLAPYGFSWSGPGGFASGSEDISALIAGAYTLTVTDGNGCQGSAGLTLTEAPVLGGTTSTVANASCNGAADGAVSAAGTGGTAPYAYVWSTAPAQTGPVASGLGAGTYTCMITDANGCTATVDASVGEPAALIVAITSTTDVLCSDGANGAAQASASGGTGPYQYSWATTPAQSGPSATGLPRGTFTVTATDANGCSASAQATIGGPTMPVEVILEDYQHETCFGASDGWIDIDVVGGSGSYTIIWHTTPPQSGTLATNLPPGDHWVQVIDNNGCEVHKWHAISLVGAPSPLNVQIAVTPVSCAGGSDAVIDLTMSGGFPVYTHHWTDDFGGLTGVEDLIGMDAGVYHLHAFDGLGCAYDTTIVLSDPAPLAVSVSATDALCEGQPTGALEATAQGGTGALAFQWTGPNGFAASTEDISGIAAGSYQLTITDANGCALTTSHTVQQPATLSLSAVVGDHGSSGVSCAGSADGSIDLSIAGGSGGYAIAWTGSNGFSSTAEDLSGLPAGSYAVQVTDGNGCIGTLQAVITAPDALTSAITPSSHNGYGISCPGASDGTLALTIDGGTAPYGIVWSGPDGFTSTDANLSGLAPGTYAVSITDANGCAASASMAIVEPPALSAAIQAFTWPGGTNISCAAANDGALDLSIAGGVAPYAIAWSNGLGFSSSDEDIAGLEPGGYQATVTDANGCAATAFALLSAPEPIAISAAVAVMNGSNVSCAGAEDGSIDLTVLGGTAPYLIAWSNGADTEDLSGIGAGTYTVTITDANGCAQSATYALSAPATFDIVLTAATLPGGQHISCQGASDGSLQAVVNGGTLPHALSWSGPNGFTGSGAALNGLAAGSYTLTVTDANGCSSAAGIVLTEPQPVTVQIASTTFTGNYNIPCAGLTIGNAQATAQGGTPGYSFVWSGPDGYASSDAGLFGLAAGSYTVVASDANGCTGSASITLQQPEVLETVIAIADQGGFGVSCIGNDGSGSVSVSGGTSPYFIGWTGPNGFASTQASVSGLAAGDYQVTVIDANGCMSQQAFTLSAPEPLAASFTYTANTCPDELAGAIDLSLSGGAAPYTLAWSGPNGFSSADEDLSGLATGAYTVQVSDALGCSGQFTAQLNGPAPIHSGSYVSHYGLYNLQCMGDSSGAITLTPAGGTTPFSVSISGPGGFASTSLANQGLVAGDYLITITDANGCAMDTTVTLTQPNTQIDAAFTVSVYPSGTNVSCFGASDGWIDADVSGGSGPYTFDWRGPDSLSFSSEDIFNLPAGAYAYELVVIDANQCAFFTTITLTQPDSALWAEAALSDHNGFGVSCPDAADGAIALAYGGGNQGYTVHWTGPNGFSASADDLQGLVAGAYTATITDMNGCTLTQTHVLSAPDAITAALIPSMLNGGMNVSCAGASDGSIGAQVSGGAGGYQLAWSGPNGFSSNAAQLDALVAGTYCLSITDANNCTAQQCITLVEPLPLQASAAPVSASCGQANGAIDLSVAGGTGPYAFAWSNGAGTEDIGGLSGGSYQVSITDANGCTASAQAEILSTPAVEGSGTVSHVLCNGAGTGAIDITVSAGTAPFSYAWSTGAGTEDLTGLSGGGYSLTVTDANGCAWSAAWTVGESPAIGIDAAISSHGNGYAISQHGGSDGSVTISVSGGSAPYSFAWSNGSASNTLTGLPAGTYTVTVTDANGCTATRAITLEQPNDLVMPTGYTPNGDGHNDWFFVQGLDAYPSNLLTVLNRWGNVVFEQLNYKNDWAGENSGGEPLPNGTYFVILTINNGERTLQGYVDLRR
jgi:gliding motility-associated-like protein